MKLKLDQSQRLGLLRSGFICVPRGIILAGDLARLNDDQLLRDLATMTNAGSPAGAGEVASYALSASSLIVEVVQVHLSLCVPGLGIGEKRISGKGEASIRWRMADAAENSNPVSALYQVPLDLKGRDPRRDPNVIADAVLASATLYIQSLRSQSITAGR